MAKDGSKSSAGDRHKTQQAIAYVIAHAKAFSGDTFRFANAGYASAEVLISGYGAMQHGGRWNPRGEFATTYLALDVETAWAEKLHTFRHYGLALEHCLPASLVLIRTKLLQVLDLTTSSHRHRLGLTAETMIAGRPPAPHGSRHELARHALARLAHAAGIEGLLVPSARRQDGKNLVVFPTNLGKRSHLTIVNPESLPKRQ